jgi:hypothetical protein
MIFENSMEIRKITFSEDYEIPYNTYILAKSSFVNFFYI